MHDLQRAGRFHLEPGGVNNAGGHYLLEICAGLSTGLVGALEAGISIRRYAAIEVNPETRSVVRRHLLRKGGALFRSLFPGLISPSAFEQWEETLPKDVVEAERLAAQSLPHPDELRTLVFITAPCVGGARSGMGKGFYEERGRVFEPAVRLVGRMLVEARCRAPGRTGRTSPIGWIPETSEIKRSEERKEVRELEAAYEAAKAQWMTLPGRGQLHGVGR
eukprot:scaffold220880_cov18-Prasinocladus_malaysianus.AAC.2